ncbi:MAG: AAA family ATPase, partial [Prevotella sp.]
SSENLVASSEIKEWESYKDICKRIVSSTVEWTSLNEISAKVGRNPKYLRNKIIPRMISEGKLLLKYPDTPKHPNQKYRGVDND